MRARLPDEAGHVERGGVDIGFEVYGDGEPTLLLLPTWNIIHSRFWKLQIPYLARHFRVVAFDGPGNGRSGRPDDPDAYRIAAVADAAVAVLDSTATEQAVLVSLSKGARWSLLLASDHPERVLGQAFVGPSLALGPPAGERAEQAVDIFEPIANPRGWQKYNTRHWLNDYPDFLSFFFAQVFSEPHSTKQREDATGWASETTPQILVLDAIAETRDGADRDTVLRWCAQVTSPVLVVHGAEDRISPVSRGEALAAATGGELVVLQGCGHNPLPRDPVKVNRLIADFVRGLR